jgi:PleD family two-component response regulator
MVPRDPTWRVSVSVGIAELDGSDAHPDALLKRADEALYEAKHRGAIACA